MVPRSPRLAPARRQPGARILLCLSLASLTPLFAQGLVSSTTDLKRSLNGDRSSPGVAAAAVDVVTAPVQLPLFLFAKARDEREKADLARVQEQITRIRQDPNYIFQHRLHHAEGHKGLTALIFTLRDPSVPFTDAHLRRLHREMGFWGWRVYTHPACSREFLEENWKRFCATDQLYDPAILDAFSQNPNVPDEWFERVARGEVKASSPACQYNAKNTLLRRQQERQAKVASTAAP